MTTPADRPPRRPLPADPGFAVPRLARVYDPLDPDRSDLDVYADIVDELGARTVLDIGCGTGTFACLLAERGKEVTGVDPAAASLDIARVKPFADRVRWLHGDATMLPPMQVDLATMTANVAQVFVTDQGWAETLHGARDALAAGGWLVFETRDPKRRAWLDWHDPEPTRVEIAGIGGVFTSMELLEVADDLVTFNARITFEADGATFDSVSRLRFRSRDEIETSLSTAGFVVPELRDAPDRPGRELVFLARRG